MIRRAIRAIREKVPQNALVAVGGVALVNIVAWVVVAIVLVSLKATSLIGTAALAYFLGLRHALDADHISAIDLVTRRLIASGRSPATVGTYFSLGHSTIVIITSLVVAATSASVSSKFGGFSNVGGIIGTSVSGGFLMVLGAFNTYTLGMLVKGIRMYLNGEDLEEKDKDLMTGPLSKLCKRLFVLIDRPWKIYPLGVLFGLGFDTSSEIALLGMSALQAGRGTSLYLILVFPLLFTCGMCLLDTMDGAVMMMLYTSGSRRTKHSEGEREDVDERTTKEEELVSKLKYMYFSTMLTAMTSLIALVIGTIQILSLISNVRHPQGKFWDGVDRAGDEFDVIGGAIVGLFGVVAAGSVWGWGKFRRWAQGKREVALAQRNETDPEQGELVAMAILTSEAEGADLQDGEKEELEYDVGRQAGKDPAVLEARREDSGLDHK